MTHRFLSLLALSLIAPALAAQQPALELGIQSFQEIETVASDGRKEIKTVPAAQVVPGSEVIYIITYHNTGARPATKVVVTNPVPRELAYKPGSAFGSGTRVEVSVDGARHWGPLDKLTVAGPRGKPRPATGADVTHVRWIFDFAVAPGAEGTVMYRAILK